MVRDLETRSLRASPQPCLISAFPNWSYTYSDAFLHFGRESCEKVQGVTSCFAGHGFWGGPRLLNTSGLELAWTFGATPVEKRIIHNGNNHQQPKFSKLKNLSIMAAQISVKIKPQETTQTASKTLGPEGLRPEQRKADRQVEHIYVYSLWGCKWMGLAHYVLKMLGTKSCLSDFNRKNSRPSLWWR